VRTKRQRSQHPSTVATGQQKNLPKEQSSPEEPLEMACAELETAAITEAGEEDAAKLLSDDEWLATHIEKVIAGFELNDGIKTTLIAKLREKYTVDGD
jgi:hypothetical protein